MKYVIALDIGGTSSRAVLVNEDYKIIKKTILPTVKGKKDLFVKSLIDAIRGFSLDSVHAISIGLPGVIKGDYVETLPNVGVSDLNLGDVLKKEFGLPVYLTNDAEAALIAEANLGVHKNLKSIFFLTISTGVGGAFSINGEIQEEPKEIGHSIVTYKEKKYEFEHLCSGAYIPDLCKINGLDVLDAKAFFEMIKREDELALGIYEDWLTLFSEFINSIQDKFNPEVFLLTGGVMKSSLIFLDDLREKCSRSKLEPCYFGEDAGLIGAVCIYIHNF